ncbi:hypothetical protein BDQ17DRAFT_248333 [Cyathus striatus]|nr:hypothetical protein BDQ17DRAFT_248333 [Cyathus striatus]
MMRFAPILAVISIALSSIYGVSSSPLLLDLDISGIVGVDLSHGNHYGAPVAPWQSGAKPGWYFGSHPGNHHELPCLTGLICKILKLFPFALQCPVKPPTLPPSDGYQQTFSNLTGATQAADYLTFGLVDTIADCKAMCNSVQGCNFVNSYHDVNGKDGSTQLTCSLFSACHTSSDATNTGGQSQPDGSIDYIINSDGFCKA